MSVTLRALFFSLATLALFASTLSGQEKCGSIRANPFSRTDPAVIFGDPYVVPTIELRVVDASTGKPQAGKQVIFHYVWLWWEYPYPDRLLGVWANASELTQCITDDDGKLILPEHKVEPRGWYDGKMAKGRKPKFEKLSVQVFIDTHIIAGEYSASEVDKLRKEKKAVITFPVN